MSIFAEKERMVLTGLEKFLAKIPASLLGKRVGVLCHGPSVDREFNHIIDLLSTCSELRLASVFGPQHGLFGQTQDNMIEWEGGNEILPGVSLFSLYGKHRKPTKEMLKNIDAFIVDIQDVGARLYTYVWTLKLCMEACSEAGIPVWVLDRPNPVAGLSYDGPVLKKEFFTFVGGACIPLCHRMTPAEIAIWCREKYIETCDLNIVRLENWGRELMFNETGLPWVIPSPNMPGLNTAIVYPGMVLLEAMNLSEGRGTTIPFELSGAPYVKSVELFKNLTARNIPGCRFRVHNFIPTFNKYTGEYCSGIQVHVTDIKRYRPVATAAEMIEAIIQTSEPSAVIFNNPPYEYEYGLMPFDILSGDSSLRHTLESGASLSQEFEKWQEETESFRKEFSRISLYGNC